MNDLPLVSVLMTAYNREKYIGEAIESVLASTYSNFELIIVDDCSKDTTVPIARKYESQDERIKVYINENNLGDYFNRNQAARYAKGRYIKYVDSDDIIYPHSLAIFVNGMEKYPETAVGIMSRASQEELPFPFKLSPKEAYHHHFFTRGLFDTGPSALIFRRDLFNKIGGFSGKRFVGDTEINLKFAAVWPVVVIASSLVYWRQHEGQEIVSGFTSTGYLELLLPVFENEFQKKECPLNEKQKKDILRYNRMISTKRILQIAFEKKQPLRALALYKQLSLKLGDIVNATMFRKRKY